MSNLRSAICILAGVLLATSAPAVERRTVSAGNPAARLKELEKQAAESKARAAELAKRTAKIEKDIEGGRQSLTQRAAEVRNAEETLSQLEAEQSALSGNFDRETGVLDGQRAQLADLTRGLVRLAELPPGALLAAQSAPVDAARAEMLLQAAVAQTRSHAVAAESELENIDEIRRQLDAKRAQTEQAAQTLRARQTELAALIADRQSRYEETEGDREAEEDRAKKIADEAKDLRDLVARIEAEQAAEARRAEEAARKEAAKRKASLHVPPPKAAQGHYNGSGALPVVGQVKIRFGQNDGLGTTSHGVTIVTRPGATVTAPASGVVRFSGPFRGYRQILILEHPGGYLSLIAGMTRVTAPVKQSVGAGEPVGIMDERSDERPELYYELRHNGQFVDPQAVSLPVDVKGKVR